MRVFLAEGAVKPDVCPVVLIFRCRMIAMAKELNAREREKEREKNCKTEG